MSIREELAHTQLALTASERKIVQVLLADYPKSGLGTATRLARLAGVSDPTVMRLMVKLGYGKFPDFQSKLLEEVESRLHSPLLMMEAKRPTNASAGTALGYYNSIIQSLERTRTQTSLQDYTRAVAMLLETRGKVLLLGGRFSRNVASMFAGYLVQLRADVVDLEKLSASDFDILIDMGKKDLLVVFDYRRYQADVVSFARQARERGVGILLFTDPWLSPIAEVADQVMVSVIDADSPFDTLATAVAQIEAVAAHALVARGSSVRRRIEDIEAIRDVNSVTLDAGDDPDRGRNPGSRIAPQRPGQEPEGR